MARIWPTAHAATLHTPRHAAAPLGWDPVNHLLSRFTFGPTPATRNELAHLGPDAWFARQVAMGRSHSGYSANRSIAALGPLLGHTPAQVRAIMKSHGNEYAWDAMDQLGLVTLGLQAFSGAQLYESVVDFFANHLNVANHTGDVWHTRHTMDRDVIRPHAFGSYTDMLLASARNPAMLVYLNLAESQKSAINENYGRELLELHTVGRIYSEADVANSARILTGRTLTSDYDYVFRPDLHWTGPIAVLGFRHANATAAGGQAAADAYLRYLASHPSTATNLARQLCLRYVSDTPSASLVSQVATAYLKSRTQILPMLSAILRSDEFWASRGRKVRRPTENLLATIRVLDVHPTNLGKALNTLNWMTEVIGNRPLDWVPPNGYPDVATAWRSSSTLLYSWEYHRGFAQGWWDGFGAYDASKLYGAPAPRTSGEAIDRLTRRLTGMTFAPAHKAALQAFLKEPASTPMKDSTLRWYVAHLVPLILDAPHHALR